MNAQDSIFTPLGVWELRALIRAAKRSSVPDYVAQHLKQRVPTVRKEEGATLAALLAKLIAEGREKLHNDGVEPWRTAQGRPSPLPKRERERTTNLSCLFAFYGQALLEANLHQEGENAVHEGIGWARAAGALLEESNLCNVLATICQYSSRLGEEEKALGRGLELLRKLGDSRRMLSQMDILASALIAHDKQEEASKLLDEAFTLVESVSEEESHTALPNLLVSKGRIAALRKNERDAIATFRKAQSLVDDRHPPETHMTVLTQLGMAYAGLGDYKQNIECQRAMVRVAQQHNNRMACSWGFFRIGDSYLALGDHVNAEKAFTLSVEYAPEAAPQPRLHILAKRGHIALENGRIEEGIEYCRQVLERIPERESPFLAIFVLSNLGQLEEKRKNLVPAENYLRRALELGAKTETADRSINVKVRLAQVLLQRGEEKEAEDLLEEVCTSTVRTITDEIGIIEAYAVRAELAEKQGKLQEAIAYIRKEKDHALGIARLKAADSLQKARVLAEVELYEREAQLERERRKQMERELAEAIVSLDNKQQVIEKVEHQLHKTLSFLASEKAREVVGTLKNVLMEIDSDEEEKEHALHYVYSIDNEFSVRLRERWPNLTRKQERLCGLVRAGLTSQEITKLLGISYEGLRAQRKRLRKALGLEAEAILETVIGGI